MKTAAQREARALVDQIKREYTLDVVVIGTRFEALVTKFLEMYAKALPLLHFLGFD
jgi:hypothetical protein